MIVDIQKVKAKINFSDIHFANLADKSYRESNQITSDVLSSYEGLVEQIAHCEDEHGLLFVLHCEATPRLDKIAIQISDFLS